MTINVQLVYGAGNDVLWGKGITELREKIITTFGEDVFVPRVIDYTEDETLSRLLGKWEDPTVLIGHSCGVGEIAKASVRHSMKPIPYMMGIATSIFCRPMRLAPNVLRATEIMAIPNFFNPIKKQLLKKSTINTTTEITVVESKVGHVKSAEVLITHDTAIQEIKTVIENNPPSIVGS